MSTVLQERLAAGSRDRNRIVPIPLEDWAELLDSVAVPSDRKAAQMLADLKRGAAGAEGTEEVGIHAHQLAAVLEMPRAKPPEPKPARKRQSAGEAAPATEVPADKSQEKGEAQ
jgi:hypothetical protein